MSFTTRRTVRWLVLLVLLGSGTAAGITYYRRASSRPKVRYETATVDRGAIVARLMASGTLSPLKTVQVGSQVSGRISNLYVDYNSEVHKGQIVARIDPQLFQAALEQSRANFLQAEAALLKARVQSEDADRQYNRTKTLAERNLAALADRDTAKANADAARAAVSGAVAQLAQSKAQLNQAKVNLAYTIIRSPIDGVVIARNVDVGQTVAATLQAPTLYNIAEDLAKMQIHTNVAEADIGRVQPNMTISFSVDAYPREQFTGVVSQIRNSPQTVQNVVTYDVVVDVENKTLRLRPGMTANVNFVYAESDNVLRVSNAALRFRPPAKLLAMAGPGSGSGRGGAHAAGRKKGRPSPGSSELGHHWTGRPADDAKPGSRPGVAGGTAPERRQVWLLKDGAPRPVTIQVGLSDGTRSEVSGGGLAEGDEVITDVSGLETPTPSGRPPGMPGPPPGGKPGGGGGRGMLRRL
jgi:HlyD family secretion protein